uniref:TDP43_N domain-containing protein n=1 Tax=Heterorhabditis bacteriophora TaxID=37862 RepID=A0A1I7WZZ1_HETBA
MKEEEKLWSEERLKELQEVTQSEEKVSREKPSGLKPPELTRTPSPWRTQRRAVAIVRPQPVVVMRKSKKSHYHRIIWSTATLLPFLIAFFSWIDEYVHVLYREFKCSSRHVFKYSKIFTFVCYVMSILFLIAHDVFQWNISATQFSMSEEVKNGGSPPAGGADEQETTHSSIGPTKEDADAANHAYGRSEYVVVADNLGEAMELPTSPDNSLFMTTLQSTFPGATGLKYKNPKTGASRAVAVDTTGTKLLPPIDGWDDKIFNLIMASSRGIHYITSNIWNAFHFVDKQL